MERFFARPIGTPEAIRLPAALDLRDTFDDHCIIMSVRPAVQRQARAHDRSFARRQQQAVASEVLESDALPSERVDHNGKCSQLEQLVWKQVVPLKRRIVAGAVLAVDRTKFERGICAPGRESACLRTLDATPLKRS